MTDTPQNPAQLWDLYAKAAKEAGLHVEHHGHSGYSHGELFEVLVHLPDGMQVFAEIRESEDDEYTMDRYGDPEEDEGAAAHEEGDYVFSPCGRLGSQTAVSVHGNITWGIFDDDAPAIEFVRERMRKEQVFPNVWEVSDHGNFRLMNLDEEYPQR